MIRAQVFLTDSDDEIRRKIMTHAFSGGRETAKLQRELGADLDIDVAYQWLRFFLEDDEEPSGPRERPLAEMPSALVEQLKAAGIKEVSAAEAVAAELTVFDAARAGAPRGPSPAAAGAASARRRRA